MWLDFELKSWPSIHIIRNLHSIRLGYCIRSNRTGECVYERWIKSLLLLAVITTLSHGWRPNAMPAIIHHGTRVTLGQHLMTAVCGIQSGPNCVRNLFSAVQPGSLVPLILSRGWLVVQRHSYKPTQAGASLFVCIYIYIIILLQWLVVGVLLPFNI